MMDPDFNNVSTDIRSDRRMLDNKGWQQALRAALGNNSLRVPDKSSKAEGELAIAFCGDRDFVKITMTKSGVHANMQTDGAAFEAWALALLVHCAVQKVEIALEGGPNALDDKDLHFQRFLYRLVNFAGLFRDRVVADAALLKRSLVSGKLHELYLNQPDGHRGPIDDAEIDKRLKALSGPAGRSEAGLEKALEVSSAFRKELGFDKIMRQWPVGLFRDKVTDKSRVFTGVKSAIDLIGTRGDELLLVELKKENNRKAGALSELFFYSCLMRDALLGEFQFENKLQRGTCAVSREDIKTCKKISAILLAPRPMHPLIEDPAIMTELNAAVAQHWSCLPITFHKLHFSLPQNSGEDFIFG